MREITLVVVVVSIDVIVGLAVVKAVVVMGVVESTDVIAFI